MNGKKFEYPVYFDLENSSQFDKGTDFCDSLILAFCNELEKAGYYPGVYCSTFWFTNCVSRDVRIKYPVWIAEYNTKCNYKDGYGIWQNGLATLSGTGNVDHDYCYVDYPYIVKNGGYNGYSKTPAPTPTPTPTSDFKVGDKVKLVEGATWYNGGKIPAWVFKEVLYVRRINDNGSIAVSIYSTGAITGTIDPKYLVHYEEPFKAKVINVKSYLNVRSGPGTNYPSKGRVYNGTALTISKEDGRWWYSPDVNGWMSMDYLKKV
jgi:hypothetical protein